MPISVTNLTLVSGEDLSSNITSSAVTSPTDAALFEVTTTGSPDGTIALQASITTDSWISLPFVDPYGAIATTVAITSATTIALQVEDVELFNALRVVWTATSGSGTLTVTVSQ